MYVQIQYQLIQSYPIVIEKPRISPGITWQKITVIICEFPRSNNASRFDLFDLIIQFI